MSASSLVTKLLCYFLLAAPPENVRTARHCASYYNQKCGLPFNLLSVQHSLIPIIFIKATSCLVCCQRAEPLPLLVLLILVADNIYSVITLYKAAILTQFLD